MRPYPGTQFLAHVEKNRATRDPLNLSQCLKTFLTENTGRKRLPEKMLKKIRKMGEKAGPRRERRKEDQAHSRVKQPAETDKGPSCRPKAPGRRELAWKQRKSHSHTGCWPGPHSAQSSHTCPFISQHLLSTHWVQGTLPRREPSSQLSKGRCVLEGGFLTEGQ